MIMYVLVCLLCFLLQSFNHVDADPRKNCTTFESSPISAYLGWPFMLKCWFCNEIEDPGALEKCEDFFYEAEKYECRIFAGSSLLYSSSDNPSKPAYGLLIRNLNQSSPTSYVVRITAAGTGKCASTEVKIDAKEFKQITCQQHIRNFMENSTYYQTDLGKPKQWHCTSSVDEPYFYNGGDVTYKQRWQRYCGEIPPHLSLVRDEYTNLTKLFINPVQFEDAGIYTCSVTHNGMTRYVYTNALCVDYPPTTSTVPTLSCSTDVVRVRLGNDAIFTCTADFGDGKLAYVTHFKIRWQRVSRDSPNWRDCNSSSKKNKISCSYDWKEESCFIGFPDGDPRSISNATLPVQFVIRNATNDDFGIYQIAAVRSDTLATNITLEVRKDILPELMTAGEIIGISIGVILIATILLLLLLYNKIYFIVLYKRYLATPIPDGKKYGATLVYSFSSELDKFAKESTKCTITKVREVLEQIGYKVFDERREGHVNGNRGEWISRSIEESHRIIIYLTREVIKDDWSVMTLQRGFEEMVNSGSKLILILSPGIKAHIKQLADDDDTCRLLQRAIKTNCAINQPKNINSTRFICQLEGAMPKLSSCDINRRSSKVYVNGSFHFVNNNKE